MNTEKPKEPLYYPCIWNPKTCRIDRKLLPEPMPREEAEDYLKRNYLNLWLKGEAIPQPENKQLFD